MPFISEIEINMPLTGHYDNISTMALINCVQFLDRLVHRSSFRHDPLS